MKKQLIANTLYLLCPEDSTKQSGIQRKTPVLLQYLKCLLWISAAIALSVVSANILS